MSQLSRIIHREAPRDFRTEIPNILFHMLEIGEISTSDFILYSMYRKIAGEHGACWFGTRALEQKCKLKDKTIAKCKKNISRPFECLNGKPLIEIVKGNHKEQTADTITINDIWQENHDYFKNITTCRKMADGGAVNERTGVPYLGGHKKEPIKKEPIQEVVCVPPPPVEAPPRFHQIVLKAVNGENITLTKQLLFEQCILHRKDWSEPEIDELWEILANYQLPMRDWMRFCDGTIKNLRKLKKLKELNIKDDKWKHPKPQDTKISKPLPVNGESKTLVKDTQTHPLANWRSMLGRSS